MYNIKLMWGWVLESISFFSILLFFITICIGADANLQILFGILSLYSKLLTMNFNRG